MHLGVQMDNVQKDAAPPWIPHYRYREIVEQKKAGRDRGGLDE